MSHLPSADAAVIGGGAVGLAVARRLAREGRRVVLLDRDGAPGGASAAAAGMLAPQAEAREPDAFFDLLRAARDGWASFAAELEVEAGEGIDHRRDGLLALEADLERETELARRAEWQRAAGLRVEEVTAADVRRTWPALELPPLARPDLTSHSKADPRAERRIFHFPDEAQVDPVRLGRVLVVACRASGVDLRLGSEARGLLREGSRVVGVRTVAGDVHAEVVVNAAGAWASEVGAWAGELVPVVPVRGEMLAYETRLAPPRPILVSGGAYSLLRAGGRLLVGATEERAGYAAILTEAGQAWLEGRAAVVAPEMAGAAPAERWVGLRPGSPDGLPVLGSGELDGLVHATGHYRNGILLAPLTAELVAGILTGDPAAVRRSEPFAPARFASSRVAR